MTATEPTAPLRQDYPRPQLRRKRWCSLNGTWSFVFDDDVGSAQRWYATDMPPDAAESPFDRT